jgi:hypothetical protein
LRKVESSTLKEHGEEKARGMLHPKCRSERRKVSSLLSLHFFFLCVFFSFLLLEKKKTLRRKCLKRKGTNKRLEVGVKSERAEQKLEGKLLPFSVFFFLLYGFFFYLRKRRC